MSKKDLLIEAIGYVDDAYLSEYFETKQKAAIDKRKKRKRIIINLAALAACLAVALVAAPTVIKWLGAQGDLPGGELVGPGSDSAAGEQEETEHDTEKQKNIWIEQMYARFPTYQEVVDTMGEAAPPADEVDIPIKTDEGEITFTATQIAGDIALSAWFSPEIKIDSEHIYIGNALYDQVTYTEDFELIYSEGLLLYAEREDTLMAVLEMLQDHKGCYILETEDNSKCGKRVLVYDVNDTLYFLSSYDNGEVMRIFTASTSFKQILIDQWKKDFGIVDQETGKVVTSFSADLLIQSAGLSWAYSLEISINNGQIYMGRFLYEKVTYTKDIEINYGGDFYQTIEFAPDIENRELMKKTLEAIQSREGCYLLETTAEESKFGQKIAVFHIDGVYYFVNFSNINGNVMRIHSTGT